MAGSLLDTPSALLSLKPSPAARAAASTDRQPIGRGFAAPGQGNRARTIGSKGRRKKGTGLSAADHGPLGRSPDIVAIEARSRLGLALAGRLRPADVSLAWKRAAAEHHPDRGGHHATMQAINGARDVLLGRGVT
ncbi:molecular chaperone DnaJ [Synechococcus sp. CCY 9618]|uniref:molecular chaperone DnaJ n=1 Tax=Synechococcus sp. CCY 9618 TaxID=2815602 RepID=UPI001C20FDEB|nr:molecular chaperone DnaJ [Synechococcus sp. CCY 9618]